MTVTEPTYPCAPMQAGLLFETLASRAGSYLQQVVITCEGPLDPAVLRKAWLRLVDRHDVLRTSFVLGETSVPLARVHSAVDVGVVVLDWRDLNAAEDEQRWAELLAADRVTGFEASHAPLMRVAICQRSGGSTRMLWTYHHAILDGRSRLALLEELFANDGGHTQAARRFSEFAEWAADHAGSEATETFWTVALAGVTEPSPAPGIATSACEPGGGAERARTLDGKLSADLRRLAEAEGVGLAAVLQGAYSLLLASESDRDDVLFAVTRSGRRSPPIDTEGMIGLLMVTSPVRLRVRADARVGDWLRDVHAFNRSVGPHEHAPLSLVQQWSDVARPRAIAETLFSYEHGTMNGLLRARDPSWLGRDVTLIEQLEYPFTLEAFGEEGVIVRALFDSAAVPAREAERLLDRYESILRRMTDGPEAELRTTYRLDEPTSRTLSGADRSAPADTAAAPVRFREQVATRPDRVAVTHAGSSVTYAELDRRTDVLAGRLAAAGARRGSLVAIGMARTPDAVAGILAVHRLGAAYMPLDSRYPADRVAFMLRDSAANVILSDQAWPADDGPPVVRTDESGPTVAVEAVETAPHELSHVIYTSGSTGRPKGVEIEHGALAHLIAWAGSAFDDADRDGMLASTSLSFDLSVFEILVTLALGGRIELVDDVLALAEPSFAGDVRFVNSVPSALTEVLRARDLPSSVRSVALAGEGLPQELVDRLYAHPQLQAVHNLYGPSEDTTYSTAYRCVPGRKPLIGRPLTGTRAYVVDRHLDPVGPGVAGELLLGGPGLARGYRGNPALTAERFPTVASERVYRTGDVVRWTDTGELDYLGRADDQVKIRGVRVEPAEITRALLELDGVHDAAVIAEAGAIRKRLVAYVVADVGAKAIRERVAQQLPAAFVPALVHRLPVLPLSANGKLDRAALARATVPEVRVAGAGTVTEQALAEVWADVLEIDAPAGAGADFFALGGDSLDALQLLTAIEDRFDRRLSVRTLLGATTLEAQAATIDAARAEPATQALIPLRAAGSKPPWVCVLTDQRGVVGLRNVLPALLDDQPVYAMQAIDPRTTTWRASSVEAIAEASVASLRGAFPIGPYRLGGHSLGGLVAFEMARQLIAAGEEIELVVLLDIIAPHHWRVGGQMRSRDKMLRGASIARRLRGQANLARYAYLEYRALAQGKVKQLRWPRGFDDPWDQFGAGRIMRDYRPDTLEARVVVLHTERSTALYEGPHLGWQRYVGRAVETHPVPGEHITIFAQPHVETVAAAIADVLSHPRR